MEKHINDEWKSFVGEIEDSPEYKSVKEKLNAEERLSLEELIWQAFLAGFYTAI